MAKKKERAPSIAEARVYRELKTAITGGQYRAGSVLVQEELCRQFKASRTPVRDALTHLQAEGLVVAMPNKGVVVRDFSPKDVYDIYENQSAAGERGRTGRSRQNPQGEPQAIIDKASALSSKEISPSTT